MAEETPTREDTVEANLAAIVEKYGTDAYKEYVKTCLTDISVSLAMLVDNGGSSNA